MMKLNFEVVSIVLIIKYLSQVHQIEHVGDGCFEILMTNHKVKTAHCIMNTNIQQWKLRHTGNQMNFADNNSIFLGSESS